jgi:hypothetical protein
MFKTIHIPCLDNRTELDRVLLGHNPRSRLATNREIPIDQFHKLVYSDEGIVILFLPRITLTEDGRPCVAHFRHGMCSPISFGGKVTIFPAPALILID